MSRSDAKYLSVLKKAQDRKERDFTQSKVNALYEARSIMLWV